MPVPYDFFETFAVANAVSAFAEALTTELDALNYVTVLAPEFEDYRVGRIGPDLGLEFELNVSSDARVTVCVPFSSDHSALVANAAEVGFRVAAMVENLHETTPLREEVQEHLREKLHGRPETGLVDVRLAPIDLIYPNERSTIEIVVDGISDVLGYDRERWTIDTFAEAMRVSDVFLGKQRLRYERRRQAEKLGAVGFIDPIAAALVDRAHIGRSAALRTISRRFSHSWFDQNERGLDRCTELWWCDGVVRGSGRLTDGILVLGTMILSQGRGIAKADEGRQLSDFVPHSSLRGRIIEAVEVAGDGYAGVRVSEEHLPFSTAGRVLETP